MFRNFLFGSIVGLVTSSASASSFGLEGAVRRIDWTVRSQSEAARIVAQRADFAPFSSRDLLFDQETAKGRLAASPLGVFLGDDSAVISGDRETQIGPGVFRFRGLLLGANGPRAITVGRRSEIRRFFAGTEVSSFPGVRSYKQKSVFYDTGNGSVGFGLIYYENSRYAGVSFETGGRLKLASQVNPVGARALVPVPPSLPMLGSGLLCLVVWKRRFGKNKSRAV